MCNEIHILCTIRLKYTFFIHCTHIVDTFKDFLGLARVTKPPGTGSSEIISPSDIYSYPLRYDLGIPTLPKQQRP